jgi:hypothetical protein
MDLEHNPASFMLQKKCCFGVMSAIEVWQQPPPDTLIDPGRSPIVTELRVITRKCELSVPVKQNATVVYLSQTGSLL